jgi:nucleoside-diphosphate-sugar epimerase
VYRAFTDRAITLFDPHFKRNFVHVRDIAGAFLHALAHYEKMNGEPYNLGLDDANLSKVELCEVIRKHVPAFVWNEAKVGEDPDKRNYIVSNAKIAATGFSARIGLDQGIQELLRGYQIVRRSQFGNV